MADHYHNPDDDHGHRHHVFNFIFRTISNVNVSLNIHLTKEFVRLGENCKTRSVTNRNSRHIFLGRSSQNKWDRRGMRHELERKEI